MARVGVGDLPDELLLLVFSHLDAKDVISCTLVSKHWCRVCNDDWLWRNMIQYRPTWYESDITYSVPLEQPVCVRMFPSPLFVYNCKDLYLYLDHKNSSRHYYWRMNEWRANRDQPLPPGVYASTCMRGSEERDVEFFTKKHLAGNIAYLLPLLVELSPWTYSFTQMLQGGKEWPAWVTFGVCGAATAAIRYFTYDAYHTPNKRIPKTRGDREAVTVMCVVNGYKLAAFYLAARVAVRWLRGVRWWRLVRAHWRMGKAMFMFATRHGTWSVFSLLVSIAWRIAVPGHTWPLAILLPLVSFLIKRYRTTRYLWSWLLFSTRVAAAVGLTAVTPLVIGFQSFLAFNFSLWLLSKRTWRRVSGSPLPGAAPATLLFLPQSFV